MQDNRRERERERFLMIEKRFDFDFVELENFKLGKEINEVLYVILLWNFHNGLP